MSEYQAAASTRDNAGVRIENKAILAASIGTALEWYDVFLFLSFSLQISKLFFPAANSWVSLLATVGTFAVSYVMKPLGALVFSSYADRVSRKSALTATLSLMAIGIGMTAFAPQFRNNRSSRDHHHDSCPLRSRIFLRRRVRCIHGLSRRKVARLPSRILRELQHSGPGL